MFSGAKVVCDVCHMLLQSKENLAKHMERHHKLPFRLKGKKLSKRPHSPEQELPSPTYTAKYKMVPGTVPSEVDSKEKTTRKKTSSISFPEGDTYYHTSNYIIHHVSVINKSAKPSFVPPRKASNNLDKTHKATPVVKGIATVKDEPHKKPVPVVNTIPVVNAIPAVNTIPVVKPLPLGKPAPVKKVKKNPPKAKFGNKQFKTTKKYEFFADLAKDMGLNSKALNEVKEHSISNSVSKADGSDGINLMHEIEVSSKDDSQPQPKPKPTPNTSDQVENGSGNKKTTYTGTTKVPKMLKPGKNDCGSCTGCKTAENCQACRFCVNPNLKKKCSLRVCIKKQIKSVATNVLTDDIDKESISNTMESIIEGNESTENMFEREIDVVPQRHYFECKKCNKKFRFPKWLLNHMKKGCADKTIKFRHCPVCGKLVRKDYFSKHVKIHTRPMLKCNKCKGAFKNDETLQAHKKSIHDPKPESIQSCEVCKKVFKNEIQMKQHMSKYHREKDIKCEECPMMFATKGGLRRHMKNHTAIITLEMDEHMYSEEDEEDDSFD